MCYSTNAIEHTTIHIIYYMVLYHSLGPLKGTPRSRQAMMLLGFKTHLVYHTYTITIIRIIIIVTSIKHYYYYYYY